MRWWTKTQRGPEKLLLSGSAERGWIGNVGSSRVEVGRFSYGIETAIIKQWSEGSALKVGAFCSIASGLTVILGGNHRTDWATTFPFGHIYQDQLGGHGIVGHPRSRGDVVVGNDVWIAANVTLLSGIEIGDGAVIAASATVTRSVGCYEIWGGNPADLIRPRFSPELTARLRATRWWELPTEVLRRIAPLLSTAPTESSLDELEAMIMN